MASLIINKSTMKTVVFDFDGTLAKLNIDFNKMRRDVLELVLSYNITNEQLQTNFILEAIEFATVLLNQRSEQTAKKFYNEASTIIENIEVDAASKGELFDYTRELLNSLKSHEISYGIITRNCSKAIKIVFPDILSFCPVVVCRDHVNNVKPHPDHLNIAIQKLGGSADETLMIGDHPLDIKTGHNAGTKTCGVLSGRCQKEDFMEAGADIILPHALDLLTIIK